MPSLLVASGRCGHGRPARSQSASIRTRRIPEGCTLPCRFMGQYASQYFDGAGVCCQGDGCVCCVAGTMADTSFLSVVGFGCASLRSLVSSRCKLTAPLLPHTCSSMTRYAKARSLHRPSPLLAGHRLLVGQLKKASH